MNCSNASSHGGLEAWVEPQQTLQEIMVD